jgi:protein PsiE
MNSKSKTKSLRGQMAFLRDVVSPRTMGGFIHYLENIFLLVIAGFTVVAMLQEVVTIIDGRTVALKDLLLMFIYVEVLAMVGVYYDSKKIPITFPLYIAITALARLVILQGKDQPPMNLLIESGAILILSVAAVVITYAPGTKVPSADTPVTPPVKSGT